MSLHSVTAVPPAGSPPVVLREPPRGEPLAIALGATLTILEAVAAIAVVAMGISRTDHGALVALVVVALAGLDVSAFVALGQGLAWKAAGIRLLAVEDYAPLGIRRLLPPPAVMIAAARGVPDAVDPTLPPLRLASPRSRPSSDPNDRQFTASARDRIVPTNPGPQHPAVDAEPEAELTVMRPRHAGHVAIMLDDGATHVLAGTAILGRRPRAEHPGDSAITVTDLSRTLSRSHLRLELDHTGYVIATDLGSTNGSSIDGPDGQTTVLAPHARCVVPPGSTVRFGDHSLTITAGGA